jgi:transposase-like protein
LRRKQRRYGPYTPEFRAEAVELMRSESKNIAELSRDLGVTHKASQSATRHGIGVPLARWKLPLAPPKEVGLLCWQANGGAAKG